MYEFVCLHFFACCSKNAIGAETLVDVEVAGEKFDAKGLAFKEENYLAFHNVDLWYHRQCNWLARERKSHFRLAKRKAS